MLAWGHQQHDHDDDNDDNVCHHYSVAFDSPHPSLTLPHPA